KFVDAMYAGTPALSSTVGAEGMAAGNEWNGFITDDVDEFVEKAVLLYHESAAWEAAQSKGFAIFNTQFAQASHTHQLLANVPHAVKIYTSIDAKTLLDRCYSIIPHSPVSICRFG